MLKTFIFPILFCTAIYLQAAPLVLAENGKTKYSIVLPERLSKIDIHAVKELATFLKKTTKADFALVTGKKLPKKNRIFFGVSNAAKKILVSGNNFLLDKLADQESVIQCIGDDVFLYGKGKYGNLWAVYEFIEHKLGVAFLDVSGFTHIPYHKKLTLSRQKHGAKYAFKVRSIMSYIYMDRENAVNFLYRNRQNFDLGDKNPEGIENIYEQFIAHHGIAMFIPPYTYEKRLLKFIHPPVWLRKKAYFETNPEYFSMNKQGKRIPDLHYCFSNAEFKKELTGNMLRYYNEQKNLPQFAGKKLLVRLGLNDKAINMCFCKPCQAMQKKYQTPGATYLLYMKELAEAHPDILFELSAYQRALTENPPVMQGKFPPNLVICLAPINANFSHDWDSTELNRHALKNLRNWSKLTKRIHSWYYPNPYIRDGRFMESPDANLERTATDIRHLAAVGADGTFFEQDAGGLLEFTNFTALQNYVMLKLFQNPRLDLDKLVAKFIRLYYGKAAPFVQQYYNELRDAHQQFIKSGGSWTHWKRQGYLTLPQMMKWSALLDKAEKAEKGIYNFHVRQLRLGLDSTILEHLKFDFNEKTYQACRKRMSQTIAEMEKKLKFRRRRDKKTLGQAFAIFADSVKNAQKEKPLPAEFQKMPQNKVTVITPEILKYAISDRQADVLANRGAALSVPNGNSFFEMNIKDKSTGKSLKKRVLVKDIPAKSYKLFKVADATLTPDSVIILHRKLEVPVGKKVTHYDDPESLKTKFSIFIELRQDTRFRKTLTSRVFLVHPDAYKK